MEDEPSDEVAFAISLYAAEKDLPKLALEMLIQIRAAQNALASMVCSLYEDPEAAMSKYKELELDELLRQGYSLERNHPKPDSDQQCAKEKEVAPRAWTTKN